MLKPIAAVAIIVSVTAPSLAADQPLGRKVEGFQLQDFRGKKHTLADYRDSKLVVIAFLGTECPLAKLYGPRLASLAETYEPQGVSFLGINANVQDSLTEIAAYAADPRHSLPHSKRRGQSIRRLHRRGADADGVRAG